jgi:phosphoribosylformimino-5-aminoimidazole carboxamide ribotide isomerase
MRIIPAIDLIDGKCVRLTQGDYAQKTIYNENPVEVALEFQAAGLKYLHLVDLDGAKAGKVVNWDIVKRVTSETNLIVDFGGGIKTDAEIERLFELGISQVNLGSIAVKDPEKVIAWAGKFGAEKIILSADVKNEMIAIHGWQEKSTLNIFDIVQNYMEHGITYVTCTDISTDGTLQGPNLNLYQRLLEKFDAIKLVASGGVGSMDDLVKLKKLNVNGVIVGKAIYEGRVKPEELVTL